MTEEYTGGTAAADHLCVLVHGLWGNPDHMASVAKALRNKHSAEKLHILIPKRNTGNFTYDGIGLGGERVCVEIEEALEAVRQKGGQITKISVVGYSLGGLVARYAIGLLHANGILDKLECMSFTAFASPFLGVRSPKTGWLNQLFNVFGARTLSTSGRQLFLIDSFWDTGRPLLSILADPESIFMSGLRRFKRRTLYANAVNDRSAAWYTTGITRTDPFIDPAKIQANFVKGYEDVVLDPVHPTEPQLADPVPESSLGAATAEWLKGLPTAVGFTFLVPIGLMIFLGNAAIQSVNSAKRINLHEKGLAGIDIQNYRVPLWIREMREAVEGAYENLNSAQKQDYLGDGEDVGSDSEESVSGLANAATAGPSGGDRRASMINKDRLRLERRASRQDLPTLALVPCQFEMIDSLDSLGWRKYPVWIHKVGHSHAAIIVRWETKRFEEGHIVLRHWVEEEFLA